MNAIISEILYLQDSTEMTLLSILYKVLSKYEFSLKKNELCVGDSSWQVVLRSYLERMFIRGLSPNTIENYKIILKNALGTLNKQLNTITQDDISMYFAYKRNKDGCTPTYIKNTSVVLSTFFDWCRKNRYVDYNPVEGIDPIKVPSRKVYGFQEEEIEKMRIACGETNQPLRNRCIVELLNSSGMRGGELVALNIGDIDLNGCRGIIKHGKGDKERIFLFSKVTRYYLKKYLKTRPFANENDPLFVTRKNTRFAGVDSLEYVIGKLGELSGVANAHPHRFRHTFITRCINVGIPLEDAQALVGHSYIGTTKEYYDGNIQKMEQSYLKMCS